MSKKKQSYFAYLKPDAVQDDAWTFAGRQKIYVSMTISEFYELGVTIRGLPLKEQKEILALIEWLEKNEKNVIRHIAYSLVKYEKNNETKGETND